MKTISEKVLNIASDINQEIIVGTDSPERVVFDCTINNSGEYLFNCSIDLELDYFPPETDNDLGYSFEVLKTNIDVNEVMNEDGEKVEILKTVLRKIEKTLEKNLTFNIYRL